MKLYSQGRFARCRKNSAALELTSLKEQTPFDWSARNVNRDSVIAGGKQPLFDVHGLFWESAVFAQCNEAVAIKLK